MGSNPDTGENEAVFNSFQRTNLMSAVNFIINFLLGCAITAILLWAAISVVFGIKIAYGNYRAKRADPNDKVKMYCIFALESVKKINGVRGKLATQAGHAYVHAGWDAADRFPQSLREYRTSQRAYKITLAVETVDELKALEAKYRDRCGVSLVTDAGLTVFKEPTTTCLGIGPVRLSLLDEDVTDLPTLR